MEPVENTAAEILIVEDDVAHAEAIQEGLGRLEHHCVVATDGATAISRLPHTGVINAAAKTAG